MRITVMRSTIRSTIKVKGVAMEKLMSSVIALGFFGFFSAPSGAFVSTHQDARFAGNGDEHTVERLKMSESEEETEFQICRRACDHVFEHSASLCRKIPEKNTKARERCWRETNDERAQCYSDCT